MIETGKPAILSDFILDWQIDHLDKQAADQGMTISEMINGIISGYLAREEGA